MAINQFDISGKTVVVTVRQAALGLSNASA